MHWKYSFQVVALTLVCVGICMFPPFLFSLWYQDGGVFPLLWAMCLTVLSGGGMYLLLRKEEIASINHRESMMIVALGWIAAGFFGSLPYIFYGLTPITDAVFESFSGFTTTGASILTNIEAMPKGLLLWRSLTHWLGGMGIIVLSLAILPFLGVGGMQIYKAEVPGPNPDKLSPRIKDTAMLLWRVYVLFTAAEVVFLLLGGMDFFDALCHSFATLATGGFSTKNTSVAWFNSAYIEWVITIFMFLAGVNFALHFQALRGKPLVFWQDREFRFYAFLVLVWTVVITMSVWNANLASFGDSLRAAAFQVVSILTTTGFATKDYELWPLLAQALLLFCMFLGGCAGSTSGGLKCMRFQVLLKQGYNELLRLVHPRAIYTVKQGNVALKPETLNGISAFFILFVLIFALSGLFLAALGLDLLTAFTAVIACLGNIGPGFGSVGPAENFAHIPVFGKWILILCMVLGRLEIYTVLVLFIPEFWKK